MSGNWSSYKDKPSEKEVEHAHEVAEKLTEPDVERPVKLTRSGGKRREYGSSNMEPLEGCSAEESDLIRHLIGLSFAGYTQREAFEKADINPNTATSLMRRRVDAVEQAKQEMLARCMNEYQANLWILRSALSEMGFRAVRTLGAVMDDPAATGHTKMKAATAILKLVNVDGGVSKNENNSPASFLVTLKDARTGIESDAVHIVDAEDAEVIDESEAECASGVC